MLLHMAQSDVPLTSESLAKAMHTNPVVVRRTMAGLREQGFVTSEKGHGGGWRLSCDLKHVTLLDVYKAVESPALLAIANRNENSECQIETAVNTTTREVFAEAEALLLRRFQSVTLATILKQIKRKKEDIQK